MTDKDRRYVPARVVGDPKVPKHYRRSGWIVFDTKYPISEHLMVHTRKQAEEICHTWNTMWRSGEIND